MPSSQTAATERRNERIVTHEPPKLKTTLKTPPKQATNPLQFVKVGPCSLYRTAQEQLQKVQEVKKIKQEVRDDPEDWQSNLDNWKSSRRKRQEHIIERVVEVKKLELEEHDRQRRRSKTFSEMMEERGSRGRKLSMSLAMYHEEDANDLSDLGIGTSSGKSSVSGDTHDDTQSVLSDRDSEIEKNHSDLESVANENGNANENMNRTESDETPATDTSSRTSVVKKPSSFADRFHNDNDTRAYDPVIPATASSPEPEEYTYEGAIRGYVSRVTQNIPRRSLVNLDVKLDNANPNDNDETGNEDKNSGVAVVKVDVLKRREIFEKAAQIKTETRANNINNNNNNNNNNNVAHSSSTKSIKERLSSLEKQSGEVESAEKDARAMKRLSGDMSSIRERFSHLEKQTSERESKVSSREASSAELESARRLSGLEKYGAESPKIGAAGQATFSQNGDGIAAAMFKDRLVRLDASAKSKEASKKNPLDKQLMRFVNEENSTPSERSLSPDTEYRVPRAAFHRSLDSLDADASSGPDTFERVQSLEELDYSNRYPPSSSSAELLNDTDREDSGIHTADVSCAVSQADENVEEELVHQPETIVERQETTLDDEESLKIEERNVERITEESNVAEVADSGLGAIAVDGTQQAATSAVATKDTADTCSSASGTPSNKKNSPTTNLTPPNRCKPISEKASCGTRPIVYQSPRIPPRRAPPESSKDEIPAEPLLDINTDEATNSPTLPVAASSTEPQRCKADESTLELARAEGDDSTSHPVVGKSSGNAQDAKRSVSKIPTPLPRKSLVVKHVPSPARVPPQQKLTSKPTGSAHSKIPFSTATSQSSKAPDECGFAEKQPERRRTVVEVCEKVSQDETSSPPVTPFITVVRIGKERSSEESIAADSSDEETTSGDETSPSVEYEEVGIDGPTMDLVDLEDSVSESVKSNKPQQQIIGDQREPESPRPVPLPVQLSPFSNKTLTFGEPDFFGTLSPSSKQIPQMNVSTDEEFVTGMTFPLGPSTNVEPPKEKPPPPPTDLSDEESLPVEPLKRLNSTRRIKKELRTRRSDFLGIEGINDDDLEREVTLTRPPDMASILAAERRIEQLDRRSYDTDSNYEQDSSHERDSGVELGHTEDWSKQPVSPDMSQHSRQSSEPFGASVTSSEEDEITKKEREIIEVLEKEEQWRYGNDREQNSDIGEKLAHKLRELEEEKMQLERNRAQETELHRHEESLRKYDENDRKQEEDALRKQQQEMARQQREAERVAETAKRAEEKKLREDELMRIKTEQLRTQGDVELQERRSTEGRRQENVKIRSMGGHARGHDVEQMAINTKREDDFASGEVLRVERELLQLEQEELKRRRSNMAYREQRQLQLAEQLQEQWQSLQDVANVSNRVGNPSHYKYVAAQVNYRSSMPNLQLHEGQKRRPPPPPIPPSKPSRLVEQMQRDVTIRNSRIPSADSIPQQVEDGLGRTGSTTTMSNHAGQQMTRETLHALSAVPRPRIVKGDQWVQRRKSDVPRGTQEYNYQHWLIQEAEQRRINEKNQRSVGRKPQQHVTGTSVPYAGSSATRPDGKPLPDSIIQTLTQRVQNRVQERPPPPRRRLEQSTSHEHLSSIHQQTPQHVAMVQHPKVHQYSAGSNADTQEKMLSVSGKKKCSHCGDELGRGAAMIIESLRLFYHMECFKCCVCHVRLGDGLMGTDVRVRNHKLHCHNCYSSDDGVKFSCV